jgi:hypothetical protein
MGFLRIIIATASLIVALVFAGCDISVAPQPGSDTPPDPASPIEPAPKPEPPSAPSGSAPNPAQSSDSQKGTASVKPAARELIWSTSQLHDKGGRFGSLAIDRNDKVHIAHSGYSGSQSVLYHTTDSSGSWKHEIVDSTGVAESVSIAIDGSGGIHISYYATDGKNDLKYAYKSAASGSWIKTTVDTAGTVGQYNAIAVDDANRTVHIVYGDLDSNSLDYATNGIGETDGWSTETIDGDTTGQVHASIAIDASGKCHVAYRAQTSTLKYVSGSLNSWVAPVTIDSGGAISDTSIAIDSANKAHIAYHRGGIDKVKYATNSGGSWLVQELEDSYAGSRGKHTSIAIDNVDNIYISYYKESSSSSAVKIIRSVAGTWRSQTIDERGDDDGTGKYTSIGIDRLGRVHISYHESNGSDLKYAMAD